MSNSIPGSDCCIPGQIVPGDDSACAGGGPATYNEEGHGGVVCGGSGSISCVYNPGTSGGCVAGGSSPCGFTYLGSGGALCGGSCGQSLGFNPSGGTVCGGAGVEQLVFNPTASGGCVAGGSGSNQISYGPPCSGGVVCGGNGSESCQYNPGTSGGVVCGGAGVDSITGGSNTYNETGSGGCVCGGNGLESCVFNPGTAGGCVAGGAGDCSKICNEAGSGGTVAGGAATIWAVFNPGASGGAVVGGSAGTNNATNSYSESMAGGVRGGGSASITQVITEDPCCAPNVIIITPAGGIVIGGAAAHRSTREPTSGGIVCGGSATINSTRAFDGFEAVYHLCEQGNGTAGEFIDSSGHAFHAQGGKGFATQCPEQTTGVFYRANEFDGRDFVNCPEFRLKDTQPHQITLWAKRENRWLQRVFYSIGQTDGLTPEGVQLQLGHTSRNKPFAKVQVISGDDWKTYQATGTTELDADCWYHLCLQWEPGVGLSIYVDGELDGFVAVTETTLVPSTSGSYIGRTNNTEYAQAKIQEVRITPELKDESWLAADYQLFCNQDFYTISEEENPVYS